VYVSPPRGKYKTFVCGDTATAINKNNTTQINNYRCRKDEHKGNSKKLVVECPKIAITPIVEESLWIEMEEYKKMLLSGKYCSYSPPRGPHKTLFCGTSVEAPTQIPHTYRCTTHINLKGRSETLLEVTPIKGIPVVQNKPTTWCTARIYMEYLLSGEKFLCAYSPLRGKNTRLFCGTTLTTPSDNFWYNRCDKCYGKRGGGMDLLLGVSYNLLSGKSCEEKVTIPEPLKEVSIPEDPSSELFVHIDTKDEILLTGNQDIQNILGPTWYTMKHYELTLLVSVTYNENCGDDCNMVKIYGKFPFHLNEEDKVTKEILLQLQPVTISSHHLKQGDLEVVKALLED
jgi:hypothetical protein